MILQFLFPDRLRHRRAFSLVELLVTVSILAILSCIVTFRFAAPLKKMRVENAISRWIEIDQIARRLGKSTIATLRMDSAAQGYEVRLEVAGERSRKWFFASPTEMEWRNIIGESVSNIVFRPQSGASDYLVIVRERGNEKSVFVAGGTGHVKIQ